MKESGQERKEKKNRYREFTASFAGLPLSVILFWLAVKQPFSDVGILLCLLFLTGAAVSFLTAVINGIIAFIRLKKKFPEKIPQQKLPEAGQRERMPALSMALVITGCIFAGTCLPLFAAHIFSADDFPLLVLLMFMSGSAAAVTERIQPVPFRFDGAHFFCGRNCTGGGRDFRQKDPELKFQPLDKQMNRTKHKK